MNAKANDPIDLSHPITADGPCTFSRLNQPPTATFQEGDSLGTFFLTSVLHNLGSNLCTHMDLAGHIVTGGANLPLVGEYPVANFLGDAIIIDVRDKMAPLAPFFDENGRSIIAPTDVDGWSRFIAVLPLLEISKQELIERVERVRNGRDVRGVIFLCGNARFWKPGQYNANDYAYFFNVYLAEKAAQWLVGLGITFVGIDAFQLEDPMINFRGDEAFLAKAQELRRDVLERLGMRELYSNHRTLLSNQIAIYENLNLSPDLANRFGFFAGQPLNLQLPGLVDNAVCRPVFIPRQEGE